MSQCPQCGRPVDAGIDFCPSCGYYVGWDKTMAAGNPQQQRQPPVDPAAKPLPPQEPKQPRPVRKEEPPPPPPTGPTIVCQACGDVNAATRTYCQRCGERLPAPGTFAPPPPEPGPFQPPEQWQYPQAPPPPGRQINRKAVLAVLVAVVLIIVGVVFATTRGGGKGPAQAGGNGSPTVEPSQTDTTSETATTEPPGKPVKVDRTTMTAEATSELAPNTRLGRTYDIENVLDGDAQTAWNSDGAKVGDGVGQVLTFRFADKTHLVRLDFINGYARTASLFRENGRVRGVAITTDAGTFETELADRSTVQSLSQDFGETDSVSIRVTSVYPGSKYPDLAVTEVGFVELVSG